MATTSMVLTPVPHARDLVYTTTGMQRKPTQWMRRVKANTKPVFRAQETRHTILPSDLQGRQDVTTLLTVQILVENQTL